MPQLIEKLQAIPWIAHLFRMVERFNTRLGNQGAAAITYFSVLSLVPVLMFAFSALGMLLTVFRPDLLDVIHDLVIEQFPPTDEENNIGQSIVDLIEQSLNSWPTIIVTAVGIFAWSGANWVANLKSAIRAQMRVDFDVTDRNPNYFVEFAVNLGIMMTVLITVLVMFTLNATATALSGAVVEWLQIPEGLGGRLLINFAPIAVSLVVGFLLFAFVFRVSAEYLVPPRIWATAAAAGSIVLSLLQVLAALLWRLFSFGAAAAVFGQLIVLMLFFNLFATLILLIAAWMSTYEEPKPYRSPLADDVPDPDPDLDEPVAVVRRKVAEHAVRVGMGTGWMLGAATGVGLGALVARGLARLKDRRPA